MWSVFPDGSRYFSRTLDERGPLAKLRGASPARPFALPFFLQPDSRRPLRLEVNVVLPAGGRVTLDALRFGSDAAALAGLLALGFSGLGLLAGGGVALALGQPYAVWYPLVLMGVLDPVLAFSLLPTARRRFEALALRAR